MSQLKLIITLFAILVLIVFPCSAWGDLIMDEQWNLDNTTGYNYTMKVSSSGDATDMCHALDPALNLYNYYWLQYWVKPDHTTAQYANVNNVYGLSKPVIPSFYYYIDYVACRYPNATQRNIQWIYKSYPNPNAPFANFTGYPLDGYNPLDVLFSIEDPQAINATGAEFTFGDGQTATTTEDTISHTYGNEGIYSVSMTYYNNSGYQNIVTKNNYILASIPSGMIVNLDVKNAITGALIQDSTVGIQNTTTGVWRNTTAPTGLVYFSTTDPGYLYPLSQNQSITLAANKTGYTPASETFNIPYNNYRARLFLMPTTITNATGAGTVVVNVVRNKDGLTVSGMSVVLDSGQMGSTNSAGAVTLFNVTAGSRVVKVTDPDGAYQPTEESFTLAAGATELVVVQVVLNGETPVSTPGSPVPTPIGTYDPDDPNSPVYGNYSTTQINEQGGAGVLGMLMQLIALWPIIVLGIFMKFIKSAFT